MEILTEVILKAGRSAIELALFVLLPVMVVMLALMRLLEAHGIIDRVIRLLSPLLRPFGLPGMGVFAALQISFVSFAAPVAALSMMEQRGVSDRHLAATLAMVMAMAQANVTFPMLTMGLNFAATMTLSFIGGLLAAAITYHLLGRSLSNEEHAAADESIPNVGEQSRNTLDLINRAGAEAFRIATGAIPMLVLALVAVMLLRELGAIAWLTRLLSPLLVPLSIDPVLILPTLTKVIAGGTAVMGLLDEMLRNNTITVALLNQSAGFFTHPLDVAGVAVLISAGRRVARVWKIAALGAVVGILVRTIGHAMLF